MSPSSLTIGNLKTERFEYRRVVGVLGDCFAVMQQIPSESIHAIVTDPPYGVKEFYDDQLAKKDIGKGGIWRIPPAFDGSQRSPLPRFTALSTKRQVNSALGDMPCPQFVNTRHPWRGASQFANYELKMCHNTVHWLDGNK